MGFWKTTFAEGLSDPKRQKVGHMNAAYQNHRARIRIAEIIGFVAILLFSKCYAATIDYSVKEHGDLIVQTANVTANKVFVKGAGGDPDSDVLFDADREVLFVIDHRKQRYLQIDNNTINKVTALSKAVSDTFGSDNEAILEGLENIGIVSASRLVATTIDTNSTLKVGGYPCSLYRSYLAGDLVSEICMAEQRSLNLSPDDFRALRSFWVFSVQLVIRAESLLSVLGVQLPRMEFDDTGGLPIAIYTTKDNRHVRFIRINQNDEPLNVFNMPKNYTRARIPFISD